jgi:hypothetical protein
MFEKDRTVAESQTQADSKLQQMKRAHADELVALNHQIHSLQSQLSLARTQQSSVTSLKASLEREKEVSILAVKKEVWEQKERQLAEYRDKALLDRDGLERDFQQRLRAKDEEISRLLQLDKSTRDAMVQVDSEDRELQQVLIRMVGEGEDLGLFALVNLLEERWMEMEQSNDALQMQVLGHEAQLQDLKREHQDVLQEKLEELKRRLEEEFDGMVVELQEAHHQELQAQRQDLTHQTQVSRTQHNSEVRKLESKIRELETDLHALNSYTLSDLLERYPAEIATYRATLDSEHDSELEILRRQHKESTKELQLQFDLQYEQLSSNHAREMEHIADQVRKQCAEEHQLALDRLKQDQRRLESTLSQKWQREVERAKQKLSEDRSRMEEEYRRDLQIELNQVREQAFAEAQRDVRHLEDKLSDYEVRLIRGWD